MDELILPKINHSAQLVIAPATEGWVVIELKREPKNSDDLHVIRVWKDWECKETEPTKIKYKHWHSERKVLCKILCSPFRYRSQARKFKRELVQERKLGSSKYSRDMQPDYYY